MIEFEFEKEEGFVVEQDDKSTNYILNIKFLDSFGNHVDEIFNCDFIPSVRNEFLEKVCKNLARKKIKPIEKCKSEDEWFM